MIPAIRQNLTKTSGGDHAGLILSRYLKEQKDKGAKEDRDELYKRAQAATKAAKGLYEKAFARWKEVWEFTPQSDKPYKGSMWTLEIPRMIIGLGSDNILEAGLTLHHTYGVPYIPASAVKGLCSHYCNGLGKEFEEKSDLYNTLFGDPKQAGMIRFHDALIEPDSLSNCLKNDVMTPHHSDYYGSTDNTAPTDFDSPVPVTFLSVTGKFLFVITCDDLDETGRVTPTGKQWIDFVWKLFEGALNEKGIGGKTSSGYGFGTLTELPLPVKQLLQPGTIKTLTRCTGKIAKQYGKTILFKDEDENLCIVFSKEDEDIKKLAPNPGDTIELVYESEQLQDGNKFLRFKLPPQP